MERQLHTRTATSGKAPFLLIDVETEEGVTGHAYLFGYLTWHRGRMEWGRRIPVSGRAI